MFIVMKDGPKKGEIQEMKYFVARDLIIAGRAEQYSFEGNVDPAKEPVKVLPLAAEVAPQAAVRSTNKKKKK